MTTTHITPKRPPPDASRAETTRRLLVPIYHPVGGIRTYILYHYPYLLDRGYRFTFVGPAISQFRQFGSEISGWPDTDCVEAPVHNRKPRLRSTIRSLLNERRYDLIHSHGLTAAATAVVAGLGLGLPHVATSHDVFRPQQFAGITGMVKRRIMEYLLLHIDAVITVSEGALANHQSYLPRLANSPGRLIAIRNGIDVERFRRESVDPMQPSLRNSLGLKDGVVLIGFLGRFMEQKGFLPLLESVSQLHSDLRTRNQFHLVAVGSGDYEREYRSEVVRRGLVDAVSFHPAVPNTAPILAELDLLVMPSLWEACGLLAMEAMTIGTPLMASNCGGLGDILHGTPAMLLPPDDQLAWTSALRKYILMPTPTHSRTFASRAATCFASTRSAAMLHNTFQRVLNAT